MGIKYTVVEQIFLNNSLNCEFINVFFNNKMYKSFIHQLKKELIFKYPFLDYNNLNKLDRLDSLKKVSFVINPFVQISFLFIGKDSNFITPGLVSKGKSLPFGIIPSLKTKKIK